MIDIKTGFRKLWGLFKKEEVLPTQESLDCEHLNTLPFKGGPVIEINGHGQLIPALVCDDCQTKFFRVQPHKRTE